MTSQKRCLYKGLALTSMLLLVACGPMLPVQDEAPALQRANPPSPKKVVTEYKPPVAPMKRGVAEGVTVDKFKQFNDLQKFGIFIADSREGTHIILPGDRLFFATVPDVILQPDFYEALNDLARLLDAYPTVKIAVIGHTSNTMSASMQAEVSMNEARAVADYLSAVGVSPGRITRVDGMSNRQPIAQNDFVGRQLNRRVEVIVGAPLS